MCLTFFLELALSLRSSSKAIKGTVRVLCEPKHQLIDLLFHYATFGLCSQQVLNTTKDRVIISGRNIPFKIGSQFEKRKSDFSLGLWLVLHLAKSLRALEG